ncbi:phage tail-collar fiber domain-containing protein [Dickeya undicola]|uniref:phage tail-collar fiber domain-containing protein n=1 Tax=Dickeya undicola TaxID=1577887 RepID=UPI000532B5C3|nr:phage tail protein [Dickeya undicola]
MGTKYFTLLTQVGEKKLAAAIAAGKPLELVQMGVGDGNGVLPTPDSVQTRLVNERRRGVINSLTVDPNNPSQMIAEQVIPENEGGFWLREIGLYDVDGDLIALGNCPETYKPELKEGSGRVQTVRMILIVSHTDAITLKFDPTVALATRRYADTLLADHVAAVNPHKQYAPIESPTFTGTPAAPTAVAGTSTTQLATTAFVADAVAHAVGLLSDKTDSNFKLKLDINDIVGIPQPWAQATAPAGWLKCNGQAFDKSLYPRLAQVYPSGVLPDLRGEFIRGWDDGRGVDGVSDRQLLSREPATLVCTAIGPDALHQVVIEGSVSNSATIADFNAGLGADFVSDTDYASTLRGVSASSADLSYIGNSAGVRSGVSMNRPLNSNNSAIFGGMRPRNIAFNYIVRAA